MLKFICVGLLMFSLSSGRSAHDFHASMTQMQYNAADKTFEISIRIFTDDLEKVLSQQSGAPVRLSAGARSDAILEKYVRSCFVFMTPQKQPKPIQYIGHEVEVDANWIYLAMPYSEPFRGGVLRQNVLIDTFADQVNLVHVQYQGEKKTFVFRKNQPVQAISF